MLVGGAALTATAETNAVLQIDRLFILPEPHLRGESTEPHSPPPQTITHPETQAAKAFTLSTGRGAGGFRKYQDFVPVKRVPEPNDRVSRCLESIFRPEEFHVGKTTVSSSILTAIKRKNPLCLLNFSNVLTVTW